MQLDQSLATSSRNVRKVPVSYGSEDILKQQLESAVKNHWGFSELNRFGENFKSRPLSDEEIKIFFATLTAFVGDIPGGILSLALRVTDHWMGIDPLNATHKGASVLFAAVDEYGLHEMEAGVQRTHHQLFIDVAEHWKLTGEDLLSPSNVLPEGASFGKRTADYYRFRSIPTSLGFHYASEATSSIEFEHYLTGFQRHSKHYNVTGDNDPALFFFVIHTEVETSHRDMAVEMIKACGEDASVFQEAINGVEGFMDGYGSFFRALNNKFFSER